MPRYFLTRLEIEGFRGINNQGDPLALSFKTDQVNSLFAANALGKSSIFEALSFAIKGCIPKLERLPSSENPSTYYANRFHGTGTSTVSLTLKADDGSDDVNILVTRDPSGKRTVMSPSGFSNPDALLRSLDTELALLNHEMFLEFVDDTPLKRGRTFSGLLGLSALSEFRQVLEVLSHRRNLNTDFELDTLNRLKVREEQIGKEAERKLRTAYRAFFSKDPDSILDLTVIGDSVLAALKAIPAIAETIAASSLSEVDFEVIRTALKTAEGSDKRNRLSKLLQSITLLENLKPVDSEVDEQAQLRAALEARATALGGTRGALFHELYLVVQKLYSQNIWTDRLQCPACESALDKELPNQIAQKLQQYTDAEDRLSKIKIHWNTASWTRRLKSLEEADALAVTLSNRRYTSLTEIFLGSHSSVTDLDSAISYLVDLDKSRQEAILNLQREKDLLEKELPPSLVALTEQVEHTSNLQQAIKEVEESLQRQRDIADSYELRNAWATFIEMVSGEFSAAEVRLSTTKTTAIENDYRAMYENITNNPEIVPQLKKSDTSEELHLRLARFYGLTNLSAATLLPESHRNALAICIYLSTALQSKSPARFIFLDDVTSSFDAGHQWALMEFIRTKIAYPANPDGPQVIVLTHDGLLEKYFDTMASEANWHHQRLQGLPPKGFVSTHTQDVNRLELAARQQLSAGNTTLAMPLIRQYLEQKLLQVIRKLTIPVPLDFSIRDDRKMVGNCIEAISDAIALNKKAGLLILENPQVTDLESVHLPALIANWVSHYSTATGASLSPYVFLNVLDTINKVSDCFKYPCKCGGGTQLRFYRDLTAKACKC